MAKSRRQKVKVKRKSYQKHTHELVGILIAGAGIFSLLSVFTSSCGMVGEKTFEIFQGLFGILAYVMPFLIIFVGLCVILAFYKQVNIFKIILGAVLLICIFCILHLFYLQHFNMTDAVSFVKSSYAEGLQAKGSGALFAYLVFGLYKLFGSVGSYLFLIVLIVICVVVLANISLSELGRGLSERKKVRTEKNKKKDKPLVGETIPFDKDDETDLTPLDEAFTVSHAEEPKRDIPVQTYETDRVAAADEDELAKRRARLNPSSASDDSIAKELDHRAGDSHTIPYVYPPLSLLEAPDTTGKAEEGIKQKVRQNATLLEKTLASFGVAAKVIQISRGPVITRYELQPAPGVKVSKIKTLTDDIALSLASAGVRIEAPIPGKAAIGVEVPNSNISSVVIREVMETAHFHGFASKLAYPIGKDITGKTVIADIAKMPHLLIAGATGSGKSVSINAMITGILYKASPDEVRMIMIDPKVVELNHFNGIPHLMIPVVTDPKKAAGALHWAVQEMSRRYSLFAEYNCKDIERYNHQAEERGEAKLPKILVVIDELSDLMMVAPSDVEDSICRLAQMARAAGIHLVVATQRPSVNVITGVIKANIPSRMAFAVSSQADSRVILDMGGAEKLLGKGDMLFYPSGAAKPVRVQGCFISEKEVETVVSFIKKRYDGPEYNTRMVEALNNDNNAYDSSSDDPLLRDAMEVVIDAGQASISMLQRRLRVGYARAARLIDEMEVRGAVSGFDGSKPRKVLITREEFEDAYGDN
jgi:S-DNA-T family DNA segregation ATPase FtsK/SpoIIIE